MTDAVTRAEHAELLSSIRALRDENSRLEARLDRMEAEKKQPRAAPAAHPAPSVRAVTAPDALPPLTVVKLKPRKEAAPRLETNVEIAEPPEAITQEFKNDPPPDDADLSMAEAQFDRGLSMMKTGSSETGIAQMQQFVTDWPRHPKADNALYFSGMAFLAMKDFEHATEQFERVINQYPAGDAVLDSMLKLADCRLKLKGPREARATWEKIVSGFPGTAAATQAQARLVSSSATPVGSP
ncbi:MAG: tetratricopeptide repeat protein [Archangium sp.]|nr:tetratricopeptide repeat protein [Archangium sp.]